MTHLKEHILLYSFSAMFVFLSVVSFSHFFYDRDYIVSYRSACAPDVNSCFSECIDDDCSEIDYYKNVTKIASTVYAQCGPDITECEAADTCADSEIGCSVSYCDHDVDEGCAFFAPSVIQEDVLSGSEALPSEVNISEEI